MSFSVSFVATSAYSAQSKLRDAYAPAGVKALIELALSGLPLPRQATVEKPMPAGVVGAAQGGGCSTASDQKRGPSLVGVLVEASGHLDDNGGRSWINDFKVQPLYD